jgi:two-component system response regulator YesN
MIRLLIVDDEEIIVNGLYEIFRNLKELDLDIYRAYSGEEAIEWLSKTRIDIVLTDIRMPMIDGMELLAVIQKSWPQCKTIFLTGYAEFEYVYQAIQHNNVSYILKNEDHDKVIAAVESAINEIKRGIRIENFIHTAKEQMDMAQELFQNDYFLHLLREGTALDLDRTQFEKLGIPLHPGYPVILLLGNLENVPADISYWDKIQYLYSIRLLISQHISSEINGVYVIDRDFGFIMLLQPKKLYGMARSEPADDDIYSRCITYLKGMLEVIQTSCRESLSMSVSFSLGGEACNWDELSNKYYSLNQMLNYRIGKCMETLLVDNTFEDKVLNAGRKTELTYLDTDCELNEMLRKQRYKISLEQLLEAGLRDEYFSSLSSIAEPIRKIKVRENLLATEAFFMVSVSILSYINRWKLNGKIPLQIDLNKLTDAGRHESWSSAVEYLYSLSDFLFRLQNEEQKKRADIATDYIQKYVKDHLKEDLSLVRLAEQVYLNPSYLSRLFKQVKGINLSEFIDNARIKAAKEMLEKNIIKIHEVAKLTGYDSAASFTRFFRKMAGCSPLEYHESFLASKIL